MANRFNDNNDDGRNEGKVSSCAFPVLIIGKI